MTAATGFTLLGTPLVLTSHLSNNKTILLDPQAIAVAIDVNPVVKILDQRWAEYDEVGIRVVTRLDWAPVAPKSIIVATVAP